MIIKVDIDDYDSISPKNRHYYNRVYLEGLSSLSYIKMTPKQMYSFPEEIDHQDIYKVIMGISNLKNKIFSNDKPIFAQVLAYKRFISDHSEILELLTSILFSIEKQKSVGEFFEG